MDKSQTIQWVVTAVIRLVAGYVAVKFGTDAVSDATWTSISLAVAGAIVGIISVYSSVKARKALADTVPPLAQDEIDALRARLSAKG